MIAVLLLAGAGCAGGGESDPGDGARSTATADPATEYAQDALAAMDLETKIASLLMLHYPGTDATLLQSFVATYQPGGLILMADNIPAEPRDLATVIPQLNSDSALPLLIATDQEGGSVRRIATDISPGGAMLQALEPAATEEAFATRAALLRGLGINVNFGVVADQTADRSSFIFFRVLGATPEAAAERVAAAVAGESGQVLSTLKHFPGHGAMVDDSHASIPTSDLSLPQWRTTHALPFESGIEAGAEVVMFGHLRYSAVDSVPASLSARWHTILREDLGFTGITITDDMLMLQDSGEAAYADPVTNAVAAIAAGNTMLLYVLPGDLDGVGARPELIIDGIAAAVDDGRLDEATIDSAALTVLIARASEGLREDAAD